MVQSLNRREWVDWLTRVRLLLIALILGVGVVWPQYVPTQAAPRFFLPIVILWITIGILQLILVRLLPEAAWLGALQVSCDVVMITGIVYSTGLQDSYFSSLYLLVIIVASILFSREAAFITAAVCLAALGGLLSLFLLGDFEVEVGSLPLPLHRRRVLGRCPASEGRWISWLPAHYRGLAIDRYTARGTRIARMSLGPT